MLLRNSAGMHGLNGEQIHSRQAPALRRRVQPGRSSRLPPGVSYHCIYKDSEAALPDVPVVLGGIEASLRRLTHYDYWKDSLQKCILCDSGADMIIYGMGEKPIIELCRNLAEGLPISAVHDIPQTVYLCREDEVPNGIGADDIVLHSHEECLRNKKAQAENFRHIEEESEQDARTATAAGCRQQVRRCQSALSAYDIRRARPLVRPALHPTAAS